MVVNRVASASWGGWVPRRGEVTLRRWLPGFPRAAGGVPEPGSGSQRSLDLAGLQVKIRHESSFVQRKLCHWVLRGPSCGFQFCFM